MKGGKGGLEALHLKGKEAMDMIGVFLEYQYWYY